MSFFDKFKAMCHGLGLSFVICSPMILLVIFVIKDWLRANGH